MPKNKHIKISKLKKFLIVYYRKFSFVGLLLACIFFLLSMLPSLLPRPWLYQGLISGLSMAVGYGIGILISKFIRWLFEKEFSKHIKTTSWKVLLIGGPLLMLVFLYQGASWQNQVRQLVGEQTLDTRHSIRILIISVLLFVVLISLARAIRKFNSFINNFLIRFLPKKVCIVIGVSVEIGRAHV